MRNNQSQEPIRSSTLYPSSSKASIFMPNKSIIPHSFVTPLSYNSYALREEPTSQTARETIMSKSSIVKPDSNIENFIKETKQKFFRMQKRLYEHEQQLETLKSKSSNQSVDTSAYSMDSQYKFQNIISHEIQKVKQQISNEFIRKDAFQFKQNRFQLDTSEKFIGKREFSNKLQQIKDKMNHQLQRVFDAMRNQIENRIHQVHDVNRVVFSKIQKDMSEMKHMIDEHKFGLDKLNQQVQLEGQSLYPGNKRCFGGIKIARYQQILQKLGTNGQEGEQIVINECMYYLDKDGYLLDKGGYYLLNKMEQQIQLDQKQISILRKNNILY